MNQILKIKKILGGESVNIFKNQANSNKHPQHDQILKSSQLSNLILKDGII